METKRTMSMMSVRTSVPSNHETAILLKVSLLCFFLGVFSSINFTHGAAVGYGRIVPIPAGERVQYHLLHHAGPNTYKFGYDTGTGPSQSFREEERDLSGVVRGQYGFINPLGALHIVEYYADHTGFHIIRTQNLELEKKSTTTVAPTTKPPEVTRRPPPSRRPPPFSGPLPPFVPRPPITNIET